MNTDNFYEHVTFVKQIKKSHIMSYICYYFRLKIKKCNNLSTHYESSNNVLKVYCRVAKWFGCCWSNRGILFSRRHKLCPVIKKDLSWLLYCQKQTQMWNSLEVIPNTKHNFFPKRADELQVGDYTRQFPLLTLVQRY